MVSVGARAYNGGSRGLSPKRRPGAEPLVPWCKAAGRGRGRRRRLLKLKYYFIFYFYFRAEWRICEGI